MTDSSATHSGSDSSVAAYEDLRRRVLAGTARASPFGLVLFLREGLAAWVSRGVTFSGSSDSAAAIRPRAAVPDVPHTEVHAGIVQVLASMALCGLGETSP